MKNTIRILAILALAALIGFGFLSCGSGAGGGDDGTYWLSAIDATSNIWDDAEHNAGLTYGVSTSSLTYTQTRKFYDEVKKIVSAESELIIHNLTIKDIADNFGEPENTVRSVLKKGNFISHEDSDSIRTIIYIEKE
ncbi:MAG: hypothetical protein FWD78_17490 [Treponema sp.]|nr:hypothetical protein [Treponema sp.]